MTEHQRMRHEGRDEEPAEATAATAERLARDARYCEEIIVDAEQQGAHGITEEDIAVCFEMSPLCGWGSDYTPSRLRQALRAMDKARTVKVGDRWFSRGSTNASRAKDAGPRRCQGPRCDRDLSTSRAGTLYCSTRCRVAADRARKRQGAVTPTPQTPRSEGVENAGNEAPGPIAQDPPVSAPSRNAGGLPAGGPEDAAETVSALAGSEER